MTLCEILSLSPLAPVETGAIATAIFAFIGARFI